MPKASFLLLVLVLVAAPLAGCSMYRVDVQQGNVLTDEMLASLKVGMTKRQVRFLLGTPPITDPFHANRWDYVYSFRKGGAAEERRRLTLHFDGDALSRFESDAQAGNDAKEAAR
jgi:outer membrane protein assembly factor BamE